MESTRVDTSLNLNVGPSGNTDVIAAEALVQELQRLNSENKRLTETLTHMCENYNLMQKQLSHLMNTYTNNPEKDPSHQSRKRKAETDNYVDNMFSRSGNTECSTITDDESFKRSTAKVSRVLVRTHASDTSLYVRDGYQWRKYGQKVTRDNPSPRAYFKCSFAPSCPVKKKVQRSVEDPTVLVATYEGEHNHVHDGSQLSLLAPTQSEAETLDSGIVENVQKSLIQQCLVQQMATSLTKDPNFTAALATAISGRIFHLSSN